jgi:hypothetical protein
LWVTGSGWPPIVIAVRLEEDAAMALTAAAPSSAN